MPLYLALWIGPYDEASAETDRATWTDSVGALCLSLAAAANALSGLPDSVPAPR